MTGTSGGTPAPKGKVRRSIGQFQLTLYGLGSMLGSGTGSRMIYGMAQQGLLPATLGKIDTRTTTQYRATLTLLLVLVPLAFFGSMAELASATVLMLLVVFAIVNGALFVLQRRHGQANGKVEIHRWVPTMGTAICLVLIAFRLKGGTWLAPAFAGGMLAGMIAIYFAQVKIA